MGSDDPPAASPPKGRPQAARHVDLRQEDRRWHGPPPPRTGPAKAVALADSPDQDPRPRIVASGQGAVAEQILQLAFASGVKVREDADLVEILSLLEVDSPIPLEALAAVAEILAYVYRAEGRTLAEDLAEAVGQDPTQNPKQEPPPPAGTAPAAGRGKP